LADFRSYWPDLNFAVGRICPLQNGTAVCAKRHTTLMSTMLPSRRARPYNRFVRRPWARGSFCGVLSYLNDKACKRLSKCPSRARSTNGLDRDWTPAEAAKNPPTRACRGFFFIQAARGDGETESPRCDTARL